MTVIFDKKLLIIIAITLVVGFAFGRLGNSYGHGGYERSGISRMNMKMGGGMMKDSSMGMDGSMQNRMMNMSMNLEGKTGDEFDKAFIIEMIAHHEGAVKMAELAKVNSNHQEIKDLSNQIISAQNKEIGDMKSWMENWFGK